MTPIPLIALVDDDAPFLRAMESLMRALGWRAEGFSSAEGFLGSTARTEAACIVSDVQMPGMGGMELMRRLAAEGGGAPVILVTARTEARLDEEARAGGALCLLRKPVEPQALIDCVSRALDAA
ncbi:response regulator transcription factor [Albimonas pacifica]|uniref:Response regulator receiver domain-containing protein n=1 Tax=Albimonas pacifica TaxID=1114924 RepID=A0A1I3FRM8_9RHOB|nr:response regulator [Albimonas pacifica]SFI13834.1 Response regulator receiver domain-containing protein [Albimonas pacifica]